MPTHKNLRKPKELKHTKKNDLDTFKAKSRPYKRTKIIEHEGDWDSNCNWCAQNNLQKLSEGTGRTENQRKSRDHPNDSIIKIGQKTEKSPCDLRRLAVTQTPMKNHQLS